MPAEKSDPIKSRLIKSLIPAVMFIALAIVWTDRESLVPYLMAAAGVAFAVEGFWKYRKDRKKEST